MVKRKPGGDAPAPEGDVEHDTDARSLSMRQAGPVAEGRASLTSRTLSGLRWNYLGVAGQFSMQLGYQAVVNRLLDDSAFGLMAIGLVVLNLGQYIADMGVGQALVQKQKLTEDDIHAGFTSSLLLGLVCMLVFVLGAPTVAGFFDKPAATGVVRGMGVSLFILSLGVTSTSLLRRDLRFRELALRTVVSYAIGYLGVGIGLALAGAGVYSLVAAHIVGATITTLLAFVAAPHSLRPRLPTANVKALYGFGGRLTVVKLMEYLGRQLDTIAVTRYTSAALAGQYSRAYFLTSYPIQYLTRNISQVLFPSFSRMQDDLPRLRRVYLSAVRLAAFILLPTCAGVAVASSEIVRVVLGPQWGIAASLVPIMAIAVAFLIMSNFASIITTARAELNAKVLLQATHLVVLGTLLFFARGRGLMAYAVAFTAGEAIRNSMYSHMMRRILHIRRWEFYEAYLPGILGAVVTAALIGGVRFGLVDVQTPVVVVLIAEIGAGFLGVMLTLRFGPVAGVRRELAKRFQAAGMVSNSAIKGKVIRACLGSKAFLTIDA